METDPPSKPPLAERVRLVPLFHGAVLTIVAIACADRAGAGALPAWLLALSMLVPLALVTGRQIAVLLSIACTFGAVHSARLNPHPAAAELRPGAVAVAGTIASLPQRLPGSPATSFLLKTHAGAKIHVRIDDGGSSLHAGDTVELRGNLRTAQALRNPHQFDANQFFHRKGLAGKLTVPDDSWLTVEASAGTSLGFQQLASRAREWLAGSITAGLPPDSNEAAVLRSMVLGASDNAPPELEHPFRYSGTMHLFAISGLHVGIFAAIVWGVLRLVQVRKAHAALIVIPAVFFYAFITGWRPSAVRAAVMLSIVLIGAATHRHPRLFNSLGAAALLVLAWDTHQLFLPGFQLSFTVLFAITLLADPVRAAASRLTAPDPFIPRSLLTRRQRLGHKASDFVSAYVAVSLAAWLGSLYPVWHHFGLVTPVSVVANLFLVPFAGVMLSIAATSASLSVAFPGALPALLNQVNGMLASSVLATAGWFAELPGAHFHLPRTPAASKTCTITVLDVGFGGACSIIEPPGAPASLIDCGSDYDFQDLVRRVLSARGIDRTAHVMLSHPDSHHVGGLAGLLKLAPPQQLHTTGHAARSAQLKPAATAGYELAIAHAGGLIDLGGSPTTQLEVLYPPPGVDRGVADSTALVVRLQHGPWRVLFMADAGFETERFLLANTPDLQAHIVVMGRHRTDHSGTTAFLTAVNPDALITTSSVFPAHENVPGRWRASVASLGIRLFDHAYNGAVTIDLDGSQLTATPFLRGEPLTLTKSLNRPAPP